MNATERTHKSEERDTERIFRCWEGEGRCTRVQGVKKGIQVQPDEVLEQVSVNPRWNDSHQASLRWDNVEKMP